MEDYFYEIHEKYSRRSAVEIIPLVLDLVHPRSVVDVGCGTGTWLSEFQAHGVKEILGIDSGDDKDLLQIPKESFLPFDLTEPISLDRQFDLVVSLEVAEHLPISSAEKFVDSLTRLGAVILFSAAIPFQGGVHHVNEQWPDYWVELFCQRGYSAIDCLRRKIWCNDNVSWWYAQNILLLARHDYLESNAALKREMEISASYPLSVVHPRSYLLKVAQHRSSSDPEMMSLKTVLAKVPAITMHTINRKLKTAFKKRP